MADDEKTPLPADKPDPVRPDPDEAAAGSQPEEGDRVSAAADDEVEAEAQEAIEEIESEQDKGKRAERRPPGPAASSGVGFVERAWEAQHRVESRFKKIGRGRYSRVIRMARKPEHEEFVRASQITAIGILVIGFLGFLILLFMGWLMDLLNVK